MCISGETDHTPTDFHWDSSLNDPTSPPAPHTTSTVSIATNTQGQVASLVQYAPYVANLPRIERPGPSPTDPDHGLLEPSNASSETDPPETPINSPDSDDQKRTTLFKDLQRDPPPVPQTSHRLPQPTEPPASAYLVSPYPESVHCWRPRKDNTGKIKYGACWGPLQTGKDRRGVAM